jgi:fructokinase
MRIGIDLGGSKIEAIALDSHGSERMRRRVATPRGDYAATLAAIVSLVAEIETAIDARAPVGVGIPGALSPATGLVKNANSTWLIGRPLDRDLEQRLGRPVRLANDADCFALSEAVDGAGAGASPVFGAILGTGVGGGIAVEGRLLRGADAIAGEWGHNPLPAPSAAERPGPACYCGRSGCIESFLSGPALAADYAAADGGVPGLDAAGIAARAAAGDPLASAALARWLDRLARALASVINLLDPEVIVLGGGLSGIHAAYRELPDRLAGHVFSDRVAARLRPPVHGAASGVRGAAWLWPAETTR